MRNSARASGVPREIIGSRGRSKHVLTDSVLLSDWLMESEANRFGAKIHIVCNRSSEGAQFATGLGGIGAILHYPVDFVAVEEALTDRDEKEVKKFIDEDDFI